VYCVSTTAKCISHRYAFKKPVVNERHRKSREEELRRQRPDAMLSDALKRRIDTYAASLPSKRQHTGEVRALVALAMGEQHSAY
jgi:hypothetical protein